MARLHRPTPELPAHLRSLYDRFPFDRSISQDPVSCVRPYAPHPRAAEIAGLVAATLAIGNTTAIRASFATFAQRAGPDLPRFVAGTTRSNWADRLGSFRHRWIRGDQLGYLAFRLHQTYDSYPSLEDVFLEGWDANGGFAGGLDALARQLRGAVGGGTPRSPVGYDRLFPSPLEPPPSPCKRLTLYVRWMRSSRRPPSRRIARGPA
ncbi:MAG TPA: DUF2400 family protein, partial [Thermoplasmata archaeon]